MTSKVEGLITAIEELSPAELDRLAKRVLQLRDAQRREIKSLDEIKKAWPNEWLAVSIPDGEDRYEPRHGRLMAHSSDYEDVWEIVETMPEDEDVYVFFNGPIATKGYSIIFHDTDNTPEAASVGR